MSINSESNVSANLQIGPTTLGMVRIYIEGDGIDLPLDFDPDEATEIAEELLAAAEAARGAAKQGGKAGPGPKGRPGAPRRR
ncbi:DUF6324 family protein [Paracoccus pacificus]|uniref:DUF6324 family protein n=1 Tax=Paracoccus pacificus TaxID=1463598 RepID=A0ABW4R5F6_9RHOB